MTGLRRTAMALTAALVLALPATLAQADLSAAEIQAIDGLSGIPVVSSDGGLLGNTNGSRFDNSRARLYLLTRSGSFIRSGGAGINVITRTDKLSLRNGTIVIDATRAELSRKARKSVTDDGPVEIFLLGR